LAHGFSHLREYLFHKDNFGGSESVHSGGRGEQRDGETLSKRRNASGGLIHFTFGRVL